MKQQQQPKWQTLTQQRNHGAGGIVMQNSAVRTAVNDPAIYNALPDWCKNVVEQINLKGLADWTEGEYSQMVHMLILARHP
jgi:hypothetical protein